MADEVSRRVPTEVERTARHVRLGPLATVIARLGVALEESRREVQRLHADNDQLRQEVKATRDRTVAELVAALEGVHVGNLDDRVYGVYRCGKLDGYREAAGTVRHHYDVEVDA